MRGRSEMADGSNGEGYGSVVCALQAFVEVII